MKLELLKKVDICGFLVLFKQISYKYYSYLYKYSKGKEAQRLAAKIASDEYELYLRYDNYYQQVPSSYEIDNKNFINIFYITLIDKPIIPIKVSEWKHLSKNLHTYDDIYNLFTNNCESFCDLLHSLNERCIDLEGKKIIKTFLLKEKEYKTNINEVIRELNKTENQVNI